MGKKTEIPLTELLNNAIGNSGEKNVLSGLENRGFDFPSIEQVNRFIQNEIQDECRSITGKFRNTLKKLAKPPKENKYAEYSKAPAPEVGHHND